MVFCCGEWANREGLDLLPKSIRGEGRRWWPMESCWMEGGREGFLVYDTVPLSIFGSVD